LPPFRWTTPNEIAPARHRAHRLAPVATRFGPRLRGLHPREAAFAASPLFTEPHAAPLLGFVSSRLSPLTVDHSLPVISAHDVHALRLRFRARALRSSPAYLPQEARRIRLRFTGLLEVSSLLSVHSVRQDGSSLDVPAIQFPRPLHHYYPVRRVCSRRPVPRTSICFPGCPRRTPSHDSFISPVARVMNLARHVSFDSCPPNETASTLSSFGCPRISSSRRTHLAVARAMSCACDVPFLRFCYAESFRLRRIHTPVAQSVNRVFDRATFPSCLGNVPYPRRSHRTVARTMELVATHPPHSFPHDETRLHELIEWLPTRRLRFAVLASRLPARRARLAVAHLAVARAMSSPSMCPPDSCPPDALISR
jgi:hypothetical protein